MKPTVLILCGGGPAPGINTVISSLSKAFLTNGYRVIGVHEGYKGLFAKNPQLTEIDFQLADQIFNKGGSYLKMSRHKPKAEEYTKEIFENNQVELLVTIGGDDTASTANRISRFLAEQQLKVANIHVPKTIDNDLPLPATIPTFGFQTAKNEGVNISNTYFEDARTSQNWFVVSCMGREAGHLAFAIGAACHFPMIIFPEMFNRTEITAEKIARLAVSSMLKRKIMGMDFGAVMISEGVFHFMSPKEIENSGASFTYDAHGHPELFNVSKSHVFNALIKKKLEELKLPIRTRPVELGFELRCAKPIAYDLHYCTQLGIGVYKLFKKGVSACMVTADENGNIAPLYLEDVSDEKGTVIPRLVDISSEKVQNVMQFNMHYISPADYEAIAQFTDTPEAYDFHKILNWPEMI